jgi:hypothetical protein
MVLTKNPAPRAAGRALDEFGQSVVSALAKPIPSALSKVYRKIMIIT